MSTGLSLTDLPLADLARIALAVTRGGEKPAAPRSRVTAIVAGVVAVTAGFAGCVCLFVALWAWVRPLVGSVGAPLVVAGTLALLCLGAGLTLRRAMRPAPVAPSATGAGLDELARLVVAHKGPVLLAALLAGLVASGTRK